MLWVYLAMVMLVGAALFAHTTGQRAIRTLNTDEKARLVDSLASTSQVWIVAAALLVAAWFMVLTAFPDQTDFGLFVVVTGVLVLFLAATRSTYVRLKSAEMPSAFLRTFVVARVARLVGGLALLVAIGALILRGDAA